MYCDWTKVLKLQSISQRQWAERHQIVLVICHYQPKLKEGSCFRLFQLLYKVRQRKWLYLVFSFYLFLWSWWTLSLHQLLSSGNDSTDCRGANPTISNWGWRGGERGGGGRVRGDGEGGGFCTSLYGKDLVVVDSSLDRSHGWVIILNEKQVMKHFNVENNSITCTDLPTTQQQKWSETLPSDFYAFGTAAWLHSWWNVTKRGAALHKRPNHLLQQMAYGGKCKCRFSLCVQ